MNPVALSKKQDNSYKNIVFLCKKCHKLVHLADLGTCMTVLEYVYFIHNGKLPDDLLLNLTELAEIIKEDHE